MKHLYVYIHAFYGGDYCWNDNLVEEFLNLDPRPSTAELKLIICPHGLILGINSRNKYSRKGYVPNPQRPGYMKYDEEEYLKIANKEAQIRLEIMKQIIKERSKR